MKLGWGKFTWCGRQADSDSGENSEGEEENVNGFGESAEADAKSAEYWTGKRNIAAIVPCKKLSVLMFFLNMSFKKLYYSDVYFQCYAY